MRRALLSPGSARTSMWSVHLMLVKHSPPGTTRRAGPPCAPGSGSSFASTASRAARASAIGQRDAEVVGGDLHPRRLGRRAGALQQVGDGDAAPADARHRPALEAGEVVDDELLGHGEQAIEVDVERLADEAVDAQAPRRWVGRVAGVDRQRVEHGQFGWLVGHGLLLPSCRSGRLPSYRDGAAGWSRLECCSAARISSP